MGLGFLGLIDAIKQYGEDLNLLLSGQYSPAVGDMILIDILIIDRDGVGQSMVTGFGTELKIIGIVLLDLAIVLQ